MINNDKQSSWHSRQNKTSYFFPRYPDMLVRFSLVVGDETINCICGDTSICNSLLFLKNGKTKVALFGLYNNSRKQLVVKKMFIKNPTSFEKEFAVWYLA